MKEHTIFKSYGAMNLAEMQEEESCAKQNLIENGIEEPTDREVMDEVYFNEEMWYEDEHYNLNKELNGRVIAIAWQTGRWNYKGTGYKILSNNLKDVLQPLGNSIDYMNIYADQYNIKSKQYHHDGTHHVEYRELREDTNYDLLLDKLYMNEPVSREMIRKYTKSLRPYVKQIYGF